MKAQSVHRSPLRILLIEDDTFVLQALRTSLEADGHTVTAASGGQQGVDAFVSAREEGEPFDAVITDLGMPYVEGWQVGTTLKWLSPRTPVIALAAILLQ